MTELIKFFSMEDDNSQLWKSADVKLSFLILKIPPKYIWEEIQH